ncbi:MAG: hypothetical protein LN590_02185 [Rickettsia endosymbiont of Glossina mortisans submortisans]|nr:hypothetical protein [Rickettsia endosymbiont of Glossina mortisans submortisans]
MSQVSNKHLIKIIVEVVVSLEFCSDDMINQDYAVQIMESIAAELQLMNKKQKEEFIKIVEELSHNYISEKKEFVKQLCENLGLIEN